jgi:hypothetical protein
MEEDKSVAYVRNKIQMAEMKNQKDDRTGRRLNVKLRRRDFVLSVEKLVISYEIGRFLAGANTWSRLRQSWKRIPPERARKLAKLS